LDRCRYGSFTAARPATMRKLGRPEIIGGKLPRPRCGIFSTAKLAALRNRQIDAVKYLDRVVEELFDLLGRLR
jgi:hypothetical protein